MKAMVLEKPGEPLRLVERPAPEAGPGAEPLPVREPRTVQAVPERGL